MRYSTRAHPFVPRLPLFCALICSALALLQCSRDPQVVKKQYLESGNTYLDRGKYKEAAIMYRRSLGVDPKYGEAHYKLASTFLKSGQPANAFPSLRRAVELLPKGTKEWNESNLNLAELLLIGVQTAEPEDRREPFRKDVQNIAKQFLDADANSYEGHKLTADLLLASALQSIRQADRLRAKSLLEEAISEFRKALSARPGEPVASLSLARSLSLNAENGEAEKYYRAAIEKAPSAEAAYLELYRLFAAQHREQEGEALLQKGVAANPKSSAFQTLLAAHYFTVGKRTEAGKLLDRMKANLADFPRAYFIAGDFYLRSRDEATAFQQYEEGERKDKAHKADYQKREIEVLIQQGKMPEAYAKNLQILKDNPKDLDARGLQATSLLEKGDVDHALGELQAIVSARPESAIAHFQLGRAHYAKKDFEQAVQQFERSIQLKPDYVPPRLALAQVALSRNDSATALKRADEALRIDPRNGAGKLLQTAAQMRLGNYKGAHETLNGILSANPKQIDTLLETGVLSLMEKNYAEAATQFGLAYDTDPSNTKGLLGKAETLLLQNKPESAIQLLQTEVNRFPNRTGLKRNLADLEFRTGRFDQAIATYRSLIPAYQTDPRGEGDLHARLGDTYIGKKDFPQAIGELRKAHELAPDATAVTNSLALLLENAGNHTEARKLYEQSFAQQKDNPEALNNLAYLMAETGGNLDEALTLATRAKQKLPNHAEISDTIGWIYLKKNLSDNAIDVFRDLTNKVPTSSTYHLHYAMAFAQKRDKPNASKQLQLALANKPDKEEENRIRQLMSKNQ